MNVITNLNGNWFRVLAGVCISIFSLSVVAETYEISITNVTRGNHLRRDWLLPMLVAIFLRLVRQPLTKSLIWRKAVMFQV
ncbi:MAG: hypothetical protein GKR91_12005 [Pseudomonadales bacterium]|nr:hypothetical protein [Pseudomonadales bacterium]